MKYYLALGSNVGDRFGYLKAALEFLGEIGTVFAVSSIYETQPVSMEPGAGVFYNIVLGFECDLPPLGLLECSKDFEKKMGRDLERSHYWPRTIDIDILFAGGLILDHPRLTIPHPEMANRAFVLVPFAEIAPDAVHPVFGKTIAQLSDALQHDEKKQLKLCASLKI